ncbi:MAG: transporter substrate-binding domain-containing protein [Rhodospirillales bacterium]|nr:transporter substrate-binding domain-containing protein [Rhodospirillales bacterium]
MKKEYAGSAMSKLYRLLLVILIWALPSVAFSETLKIAVGLWIPPYVIKDEARGIEFDILKEVLAFKGYEMEPLYFPLARTLVMLNHNDIDGIMSTGLKGLPGCYSDSHITYWNFAISLKSHNLKIDTVADLKNRSIIAFQNAKNYLGEEFKQMAESNPYYKEVADQRIQNKLLFRGRTDVVIADRYIFEWFRKDPSVSSLVPTDQEVTHHPLFEPSHFRAVFKSDKVCQDFNEGLKEMKVSGRYQEIISSYKVGDPIIQEAR